MMETHKQALQRWISQAVCGQTYECRPWTPPSIWADMVRFSNLSSPEYIMDLVNPHTVHKCQRNLQMQTFKEVLTNSDLPKNGQALCSYVLTAMLDPRYEVRDKLVYRALVLHWSWHTLGNLHPIPLTGITMYLCWCEHELMSIQRPSTWSSASGYYFSPWHPGSPFLCTFSVARHQKKSILPELQWSLPARSPSWLGRDKKEDTS